jgi:glycosyltransferase involved in cell wall biosynthesis
MKILMVSPQPFFEPRGTPISVYQRLEALSALGHEVDLLTYHVGKDVFFENFRIYRVPKIGFIKHVRVGPSRAKILLDFLLIFKTFWMLLTRHYDIIHSHEEAAFFCAPLAKLFRKRHLYDMHSVLSIQLGNFNFGNFPIFIRLFELLEHWVLNSCDAVITVASDLEQYVRKVNPKVRVIKIENIALQAFQTHVGPDAVKAMKETHNLFGKIPIVYTGTYERYQGLEMVLEAAPLVRDQIPNVFFIFVGAKRLQVGIWSRKAREMGVDDCTLFIDAVPPEESMGFLACADVLISPRIAGTTIPLKIYSYLHSGKPIVATRISAHTQVLNKDNSYLVEPTKESFAEGIVMVLKNPEIAECLAANAHEFAHRNFSYENYRANVDQIYRFLQGYPEPEVPISVTEN